MGQMLGELIRSLPAGEQERIETEYQVLRQEIDNLRQLRNLADVFSTPPD